MSELANQIESHLKALQLKGILANYREISSQAVKARLPYEEYLALVLEQELKRKNESSINTKVFKAKFPFVKTMEEFDFSFQPALNEKEVIRLSSCSFIEEKNNIILLGPPGVGKTHLAVALGIKACKAKYRVLFISAQKLLEELTLAKKDGTIFAKLLAFSRLHLLIIDELGYMPIPREQANLLFQLVSIRYEKASVIITSNYNFDQWGKFFDDNVVASAIIDRLVHHANIFFINGCSYRLKDKLKNIN